MNTNQISQETTEQSYTYDQALLLSVDVLHLPRETKKRLHAAGVEIIGEMVLKTSIQLKLGYSMPGTINKALAKIHPDLCLMDTPKNEKLGPGADLTKTSVIALGLTRKTVNKLHQIGIITVDELLKHTFHDLLGMGIYLQVANSIKDALAKFGLSLRLGNPQTITPKAAMNISISNLQLGGHLTSMLLEFGFRTIGQLIQKSPNELRNILHTTEQTIMKIIQALDAFGLSLQNDLPKNREKLMNVDINVLKLHMRIINPLKSAGIYTLGDLIRRTPAQLLKIRFISKNTLAKIEQALADLNMDLHLSTKKEADTSKVEQPIIKEFMDFKSGMEYPIMTQLVLTK